MAAVILDLAGNFADNLANSSNGWKSFLSALSNGVGTMSAVTKELLGMSDRFDDLHSGLEGFAGSAGAADEILAAMKESTHGVISEVDSLEIATAAMNRGIVKGAGDMKELARIGAILGSAAGRDAKGGVEDLMEALTTLSPRMLRPLGLTIDMKKATTDYADSIGKNVEQLTQSERTHGLQIAVMEKAREKAEQLGDEFKLSADEKLDVFGNKMDEMKRKTGDALAEALEPTLDLLIQYAEVLPDAAMATQDLISATSVMSDEFREFGERAVNDQLSGMEALTGLWKLVPTALVLAKDALVEHGRATIADTEGMENQAEFIDRVNKAFGKSFATFEQASEFSREHTHEMRIHEDALAEEAAATAEATEFIKKHSRALEDGTEKIEDAATAAKGLAKSEDALSESLGISIEGLDLLGLTGKDTAEALHATGDAAVDAFKKAEASGKFSAEKLHETWVDEVLPSLMDAYGEIPAEFSDVQDRLNLDTKAGLQQWLDDQAAAIEANKSRLSDPIADALVEGFEGAEPAIEELGTQFGEQCAMSMVEFMGSAQGRQELSSILDGLFEARGIVDSGTGGMDLAAIDAADQDAIARLQASVSSDANVNETLGAALDAVEAGDLGFLKAQMDGMANNINMMHQRFNMQLGENKEKAAQFGLTLRTLQELADILDIDVAGHNSATTGFRARAGAATVSSSSSSRAGASTGSDGKMSLDDGSSRALQATAENGKEQTSLLRELLGATLDTAAAGIYGNSPAAMEAARLAASRRDRLAGVSSRGR